MSDGPLDGVRVLDLTQGIAGPYCTKYYSDFGAEVIKIERPGGGDPTRRAGPFPGDVPHAETSGLFLHLNTGKRSVTLNLATASGQQILHRLAASADLVVESFRPGTLARLGLTADTLSEANPAAALVQISNFGQTGPYRDFVADDMLLYAMGGVFQVTGDPEREPVKLGLYMPLFFAGVVAAGMSLAALTASRRDGAGERVDISIQEVLASSMDRGGPNLAAFQYSGVLMTTRERNVRMSALPTGVYPCKDGYVQLAVQLAWYDRFCRTIDRPDLIDDPHFADHLAEDELAPEFDAIIYPWLLERTKQEVMERAQAEGLPIAALNTMEDVFADPHMRERGYFTTLDHPVAGSLEFPGLPIRLTDTPGALERAPLLGEHTLGVLTEQLGYSAQEVVILRQRGVV